MGMTDVEGFDGSNVFVKQVKGESGRTDENEYGLRSYKNSFYKKLLSVTKVEQWPVFACAEVNAAYLLMLARDTKAKNVRIRKAVDGSLLKDPCRNCSQWLEDAEGPRVYKIRAAFLPSDQEEADSRVPKGGGAASPKPSNSNSNSNSSDRR